MTGTTRRGCTAALGAWLIAGSALAHPSPAEPPAFFADDCIVVVDKQAQASFHLEYAVLVDDTAPEVDHVSLDDSKTHQFFALAGTLLERATGHVFLPFDDQAGAPKPMPTWLDADDVMRTAAGVKPEDMTAFTAEQVAAQDVLENDPMLAAAVRPLVAGKARVPITAAQGLMGVEWALGDVPAGTYQIAAYIFSPPYNGWVARPGVIKVIDGMDDATAPVAVTLEPIAARLFAGQGKRVRGCVDAPAGTTLALLTRAQAGGAGAFAPRITQPAGNGAFELCLLNEGSDEVLDLRLEARAPDGRSAATQSSGTVSLFSTAAMCVESEELCCPAGSPTDAGARPDAEPTSPPPTVAGAASAVAGSGASAPPIGSSPPASPARADPPTSEQPEPEAEAASARGCRSVSGGRTALPSLTFGAVLLLLHARRRRAGQRPASAEVSAGAARAARR